MHCTVAMCTFPAVNFRGDVDPTDCSTYLLDTYHVITQRGVRKEMGLWISSLFSWASGTGKEMRILMVGLDAAGWLVDAPA